MAGTHPKKHVVKSLFMGTDLSMVDIAKQTNVSTRTIRTWSTKEKWREIKDARSITRSSLLSDSYMQLKMLNRAIAEGNGVINKEQADAKAILRKEIEALSDNPLHVHIEVLEELISFCMRHSPKKLNALAKLTGSYIEHKQKSIA